MGDIHEQLPIDRQHDGPLQRFVSANPEASTTTAEHTTIVSKPWADDSLELRVSHSDAALVEALNSLRLPPRFSAIQHSDTKDLEFIFAALPDDDPLRSRSFSFTFKGKNHICTFGDASVRLLRLAVAASPLGTSQTNHRNLLRIKAAMESTDPGTQPPSTLTSFFIQAADVPEDQLVELARHLNFFMRYFDRETPLINIHPDLDVTQLPSNSERYPSGSFPMSIAGRSLEPYLLGLWESARRTDPERKFLYSFQVLEYAAFYFVRDEIRQTIRRALSAPDLPSRMEAFSREIFDAVVEDRTSDDAKIASVVQQAVDPAYLWPEIDVRRAFFSQELVFDGNFTLAPLIRPAWTLDDFKGAWLPKLPDSLRKLRNGLVHAREQRMARTIAPTRRNEVLLQPWSELASMAASQVLLYGAL